MFDERKCIEGCLLCETNFSFISDGSYNNGVYISNNLGADWELQNDGMANDSIKKFTYNIF